MLESASNVCVEERDAIQAQLHDAVNRLSESDLWLPERTNALFSIASILKETGREVNVELFRRRAQTESRHATTFIDAQMDFSRGYVAPFDVSRNEMNQWLAEYDEVKAMAKDYEFDESSVADMIACQRCGELRGLL